MDKLEQTIGGVLGLMTCIPAATDTLGLSNEQVMAFCDATPDGEELWVQFTARRDSDETPIDYGFTSFMIEVLAQTSYPIFNNGVTAPSTWFQGKALDRQLSSLGQQRRLDESDWDCRRRVFPDIFGHDARWAYEILVGKRWQDFSPIEEALFVSALLGKSLTKGDLAKFARGWAVDPSIVAVG